MIHTYARPTCKVISPSFCTFLCTTPPSPTPPLPHHGARDELRDLFLVERTAHHVLHDGFEIRQTDESVSVNVVHLEHEQKFLLPARAIAERRQHAHEILEVEVLKHLDHAGRERRDREFGNAEQLILRYVTLVALVERPEAFVQTLNLAMVEASTAVFLHLLDVVLGQVQARRRETPRVASRVARQNRLDTYVWTVATAGAGAGWRSFVSIFPTRCG